MKKVVRMSLLALTAIALLGSCKKKNNEPTPDPGSNTGTTTGGNGGSNNGGTQTPPPASVITLSLPAGQKFSLKGIEGENITVGGVAVENFQYNRNNTPKEFTSETGSVEIKGNIRSLSFSSGAFEKLEVPNGLEILRMLSGSTVKVLELAQAKSLKLLTLDRTNITNTLDLSGHTQLRTLFLHLSGGNFTLPNSLQIINISEHHGTINNNFDLASFPELTKLSIIGNGGFNKSINFSGSAKLEEVIISRSGLTAIDLNNCPKLKNVFLMSAGVSTVNINGCPLLNEGRYPGVRDGAMLANGSGFASFYGTAGDNNASILTLNLSGAGFTTFTRQRFVELVNLDLSDNKLTSADFSGFSKLKNLNLLGNSTLTGDNLTATLNTLPTVTGGTLKIAGLSASDKAIATSKGWNVVTQ